MRPGEDSTPTKKTFSNISFPLNIMGWEGYLCCLSIDDVVGLVLSWCLAPFIVSDGDICDELVKMDLGELV